VFLCECNYCQIRRNPDEDLRHWERAGHHDPQAYHQYLRRLLRAGHSLPIEVYYQEEIRPYGIAEDDLSSVLKKIIARWAFIAY